MRVDDKTRSHPYTPRQNLFKLLSDGLFHGRTDRRRACGISRDLELLNEPTADTLYECVWIKRGFHPILFLDEKGRHHRDATLTSADSGIHGEW